MAERTPEEQATSPADSPQPFRGQRELLFAIEQHTHRIEEMLAVLVLRDEKSTGSPMEQVAEQVLAERYGGSI